MVVLIALMLWKDQRLSSASIALSAAFRLQFRLKSPTTSHRFLDSGTPAPVTAALHHQIFRSD